MKRLLVGRLALVILCCFPFVSVAQTVLFESTFSGIGTISNKRISEDVSPETVGFPTSFNYSYCYCVEWGGSTYLQVGNKKNSGYLITPSIPDMTGDVSFSFKATSAGDNTRIRLVKEEGSGTLETTDIVLNDNNWHTFNVLVRGADASTKIKLESDGDVHPHRFLLEYLRIMPVFVMDESDNNIETKLASHSGETVDLMLIRTFRGGIWNTVCLPFLSHNATWSHLSNIIEGLTEDIKPKITLFNKVISSNTLQFRNGDENISGGTPYLLKIDRDLVNPIFRNVIITASTPQKVTHDGYSLVGTFGPTDLKTNGTNVFLGTDNVLYKPAAGSNILKGIRAYFEIPSGAPARISMDDSDEATGIKTLKHDNLNKVYNLQGQQVSRTAKGLYIINGKKIILK